MRTFLITLTVFALAVPATATLLSAASGTPVDAKGIVGPYIPGPPIERTGGPDAFGYTFIDSDEPGGPTYYFRDISGVGTTVALGDDNFAGPFPLGFSFNFYGTTWTEVYIGSNGFLSFGAGSGSLGNTALPSPTDPDNLICMYWDDLNPGVGGTVYRYTVPTSDTFIVQFQGVPRYGSGGSAITAQFVMTSNGDIDLNYATFVSWPFASGGTAGIENVDGSIGLQVSYNETPPTYWHDNLRVRIQYPSYNHDAKVDVVYEPTAGLYAPGTLFDPACRAKNSGNNPESWYTHLVIEENAVPVRHDSLFSGTLNPDDTTYCGFPSYTIGASGNAYDFIFYTALAGDEQPANDTAIVVVNSSDLEWIVVDSIPAPGVNSPGNYQRSGLMWDGTYLWSMNNDYQLPVVEYYYRLDRATGAVIDSFMVNDSMYIDMELVNDSMYTHYFYPSGGHWNIRDLSFNWGRGMTTPGGLSLRSSWYTGTDLWAAQSGQSSYHRIDVNTGAILQTVPNTDVGWPMMATWDPVGGLVFMTNNSPYGTHALYWTGATWQTLMIFPAFSATYGDAGVAYYADATGSYIYIQPLEGSVWIYKVKIHEPVGVPGGVALPTSFTLHAAYPNPFNPATTISFDLPEASSVRLDVYNVLGQKVATLVNGSMTAGSHSVVWDASSVGSGVYFARLTTDLGSANTKMTLLK